MLKKALFLAAGAAVLMASPADARYHHRHYYYRHHAYYSYYSPYYSYAYPAYSYPVYYGYPAYPAYPTYYSYPPYSSFGISIGLGGGYHHRRW